jgi:hypothetical protein
LLSLVVLIAIYLTGKILYPLVNLFSYIYLKKLI